MDEHLAGFCTEIRVVLEKDGTATVTDNGREFRLICIKKEFLRQGLCLPHFMQGKFDDSAYKTSGGLHGVGSSVVNALSTYMDVKISRDGAVYHDRYERGVPVIELKTDFFLRSERQKRQEQQLIFCLMIRFLKDGSGRRK